MSTSNIDQIEVFFENGVRKVRCFCGKICKRSILPHMRAEHPKEWQKWCLDFVDLRNKGWSYKRIMRKYRTIFTWTVIEREIKKMVEQGKASLDIWKKERIDRWEPCKEEFSLPTTTVWSFPKRGSWAVHQSDYRGNWPPQIPRSLIMKYSEKGDVIFDPFVGGGTTLIEAWLTGRKSIGIDINPYAVKVSRERIKEMEKKSGQTVKNLTKDLKPIIRQGDARKSSETLQKLGFGKGSINLICAHPPYLNALRYTENVEGDLSHIGDVQLFCDEIQKVAKELYILLNKGGRCGILVGDVRKRGKLIPLGFLAMKRFLNEKFELEDIIVKLQHRDKSTEFYYDKDVISYLIAHEYLFIFKK